MRHPGQKFITNKSQLKAIDTPRVFSSETSVGAHGKYSVRESLSGGLAWRRKAVTALGKIQCLCDLHSQGSPGHPEPAPCFLPVLRKWQEKQPTEAASPRFCALLTPSPGLRTWAPRISSESNIPVAQVRRLRARQPLIPDLCQSIWPSRGWNPGLFGLHVLPVTIPTLNSPLRTV